MRTGSKREGTFGGLRRYSIGTTGTAYVDPEPGEGSPNVFEGLIDAPSSVWVRVTLTGHLLDCPSEGCTAYGTSEMPKHP